MDVDQERPCSSRSLRNGPPRATPPDCRWYAFRLWTHTVNDELKANVETKYRVVSSGILARTMRAPLPHWGARLCPLTEDFVLLNVGKIEGFREDFLSVKGVVPKAVDTMNLPLEDRIWNVGVHGDLARLFYRMVEVKDLIVIWGGYRNPEGEPGKTKTIELNDDNSPFCSIIIFRPGPNQEVPSDDMGTPDPDLHPDIKDGQYSFMFSCRESNDNTAAKVLKISPKKMWNCPSPSKPVNPPKSRGTCPVLNEKAVNPTGMEKGTVQAGGKGQVSGFQHLLSQKKGLATGAGAAGLVNGPENNLGLPENEIHVVDCSHPVSASSGGRTAPTVEPVRSITHQAEVLGTQYLISQGQKEGLGTAAAVSVNGPENNLTVDGGHAVSTTRSRERSTSPNVEPVRSIAQQAQVVDTQYLLSEEGLVTSTAGLVNEPKNNVGSPEKDKQVDDRSHAVSTTTANHESSTLPSVERDKSIKQQSEDLGTQYLLSGEGLATDAAVSVNGPENNSDLPESDKQADSGGGNSNVPNVESGSSQAHQADALGTQCLLGQVVDHNVVAGPSLASINSPLMSDVLDKEILTPEVLSPPSSAEKQPEITSSNSDSDSSSEDESVQSKPKTFTEVLDDPNDSDESSDSSDNSCSIVYSFKASHNNSTTVKEEQDNEDEQRQRFNIKDCCVLLKPFFMEDI